MRRQTQSLCLFLILLIFQSCNVDKDSLPDSVLKISQISIEEDFGLQQIVSNAKNNKSSKGDGSFLADLFAKGKWNYITKLIDTRPEFNRTIYAVSLDTKKKNVVENLILSNFKEKDRYIRVRYISEDGWFENHNLIDDLDKFTGLIEFRTIRGKLFGRSLFDQGQSYIPNKSSISGDCGYWLTIDLYNVINIAPHVDGSDHDTEFQTWSVSEWVPCEEEVEDTEADDWFVGGGSGSIGGTNSGVPYIGPAFPVTHPPELKPCPGNPLISMEIAEQTNSGVNGGRFGQTRTFRNGSPKWHKGFDLKSSVGQPIYNMFGGTIVEVNNSTDDLGTYVVVRSNVNGRNIFTYYGHLEYSNLQAGTIVATGSEIGISGTTGNLEQALDDGLTEQHIHIIVRDQSVPDPSGHSRGAKVNPENFFSTTFDDQGKRENSQSDCAQSTT